MKAFRNHSYAAKRMPLRLDGPRRGRRVAVIVDAEAFERIVDAAEEATDRRELAAARLEDDDVPWAEVKADLGLV